MRDNELANDMRLLFQREIPVHEVEYFIKPLTFQNRSFPGMRRMSFGAQPGPFVQEKDGFYSTSLENVPAYKEEPLMPSQWVVRPWTLLYYADEIKASPEQFWENEGKTMYARYEQHLKTTGEVRDAADAAVAGARDPEETLIKLLQYCRRIKRLSDDDVTAREREKAKQNDKPSDTLKRGLGNSFDVKMLFAAMARAQGFDARVARLGDRSDRPFDRSFLNLFFLRSLEIAVKVGDQWRFYDPAAKWLPGGMLPWEEEGSDALVTDPKAPVFTKAPFSESEKSLILRTGVFEVDAEGTLEGGASLAFTGHAAATRRRGKARESAAQQEDDIRELVRGQIGNAEVSAVKVEDIEDAEKPLTYSYRVKVPGYAQRTGKRLFVPLSYFQHGHPARFPASERKYPVCFEYPWTEEDNVTIKVPVRTRRRWGTPSQRQGRCRPTDLPAQVGIRPRGRIGVSAYGLPGAQEGLRRDVRAGSAQRHASPAGGRRPGGPVDRIAEKRYPFLFDSRPVLKYTRKDDLPACPYCRDCHVAGGLRCRQQLD